ncbi:5-(carboxyamino)imidazole ribonucleotide synthase [Yunchengibacter salinarum]|uniref:5-(carboxyamino)imidazole ribonucleotide synthase n=1 Tax=Yunchengibacter salinarum TaxID=3133399 RepID=UPI0035B69BB2
MTIIAPGGSIGILGGGQLGRMLALAAARFGYRVHIFCPDADSPAFDVAHTVHEAAYDDEQALEAFAKAVSVATYEFENVPVAAAEIVARHTLLRPGTEPLRITQDRLREKDFLNESGVKTANYAAFEDAEGLDGALKTVGKPAIVKTRFGGYDGKGQALIKTRKGIEPALQALSGAPAIAEERIPFDREVSVIVARSVAGDVAAFPVSENHHEKGQLRETQVPAAMSDPLEAKAKVMATKIANALDYVGVMTLELFVRDDGTLNANEMAPRVHNSGHWTLEGAATSQFEQHIRAICGLPLGPTDLLARCRMINLLGDAINDWQECLKDPQAHYHHYGKREAREGRKMGHITWVYRDERS